MCVDLFHHEQLVRKRQNEKQNKKLSGSNELEHLYQGFFIPSEPIASINLKAGR